MSGRRPPPSSANGRYAADGSRSHPLHSSHNASPYSATRPSPAMSPRKRPTESRSRGNSPPDKRNCPPERRTSLQDRYAATRNSTSFPSPPVSRRSSTAIPTGPRSDQRRPSTQQQQPFERAARPQEQPQDAPITSYDARIMSPRSIGSGASTPAHQVAPTVPSMLPQGGDSGQASYLTQIQQHEAATSANGKFTMDSLRKIRARKAMASNILDDSIKDLQTEIAQLKKERLAMAERLDALEQHKLPVQTADAAGLHIKIEELCTLSRRLESDNVKQTQDLQQLLGRQTTFENSLKDLATLMTDGSSIQDRKYLQSTTAELKGLFDTTTKQSENLKAVLVRHERLEGKVQGLLDLRNDVALLKAWKESQATEAEKRALVAQEVDAKSDAVKKGNGTASKIAKTAVEKPVDGSAKMLSDKYSELIRHINKHIGPAKQAFDRTERSIIERIEEIEVEMRSLRQDCKDADRLIHKRLDRLSRETGQATNFHSEQSKLATRMDKFEKAILKSGHSGSTVPPISLPTQTKLTDEFFEKTTLQLSQLEDKVKELGKIKECTEDLAPTITQVREQVQRVEERLGKLVNLETQVDSNEKIAAEISQLHMHVQKEFTTLHTRLQAQLPEDGVIASIQDQLNEYDRILEKMEGDALDTSNRVSVLWENVPKLFNEKFDPLQRKVERAVGQIEEDRKMHNAMHKDKQDLERLELSILDEKTARERAVSDLSSRLATKAEADTMVKQMDAFRLPLRNLQDQYTNITSDDVHQKMVRWFLQMYPANNTNLVQQFANLRHDVSRLQSRSNEFQLFLNKEHPSDLSPQDSKQIEDAYNRASAAAATAKEALAKVDAQKKQIDAIEGDLQILRNRLHDVAAAMSTFAGVSAVNELSHSVQEVESQMEISRAATHDTMQLMQRLEDGLAKVKRVIEPNEEVLPKLIQMYIAIGELQDKLESVNKNTCAKKALPLTWTFNLKQSMLESTDGVLR